MHDWSFLFGPGFMPAINALFLATVMYRFRLVPRIIPMHGLHRCAAAVRLRAWRRCSVATDRSRRPRSLFALPIAAWEFSLGVYLIVKGVKGSTIDVDAPLASPALAA